MSLRFYVCVLLGGFFAISNFAQAHSVLTEKNLQQYKIPITPGLLDGGLPIIVDKTAAIQLGKALFWDTNVGSNGVACATCHFHAGADSRTSNQLNPGMLHLNNPSSRTTFELSDSKNGANYTLKAEDFPFFRFTNPDDRNSKITFQTDDVVGSAGVYQQTFTAIDLNTLDEDVCSPTDDPVHHIGNAETRQTTKRNAPTVINAIFNHRNFWDGRANNEFNGVSPFGSRDKTAKIWVAKNDKVVGQKLNLINASLASQALGPPVDMIEMSCNGRVFKDIAKKLLTQTPLANQEIHPEDSVLADLRDDSGKGLTSTYETLIKKSFNPIYWSHKGIVQRYKGKSYSQLETNFSFFFGLAIQMYESTLVSNQSKLDQGIASMEAGETVPPNFTAEEKKGLGIFSDVHCDICHAGAAFSTAVHFETSSPNAYSSIRVDRIGFIPSNGNDSVDATLADVGFFNTSVVPDEYDVGLGGVDPWGNPLSYAQQYLNSLGSKPKKLVDHFVVSPCDFTDPFILDFKDSELVQSKDRSESCSSLPKYYAGVPKPSVVKQELATLDQGRLSTLTTGAFKVPILRNVELTGPYMHNGGMKSLEEVVEFYNRGGNVYNRRHAATLVFEQGFSQADKDALVAFLKTLTDERVRWEKAPFDHPSIKVPNGHKASTSNGLMDDDYLEIPAVGKQGLPIDKGPLMPFDAYLK